jgi:hypothetical protein
MHCGKHYNLVVLLQNKPKFKKGTVSLGELLVLLAALLGVKVW